MSVRLRWRADAPLASSSLAATLGTLLVGAIVLAAYDRIAHPAPFALDFRVTPWYGPHEIGTHLSTIKAFFDARGQSLAHLAVVAATGLLVLVGPGVVRSPRRPWPAVLVVLASFACLQLLGPRASAYVGGAAVLAALLASLRVSSKRPWRYAVLAALVGVIGVSTLPGFLHPPDHTAVPWWEITYGEAHYSTIVAAADLLGAGRSLLSDVRPNYGLLPSVLVGAYARRAGPLEVGDWVRLLLFLQLVYLVAAAFVFVRHSRGRPLAALLALLAVVPWFHFAHKGVRFPNQTPWRTIGMALALVVMALLGRLPRRPAILLLGFVSATAVLLNFETGVAVTAGALAYAVFRFGLLRRADPASRPLEAATLFALGGLAAVVVSFAIVGAALGEWLDPRVLLRLVVNPVFTASAGFSGWPLTADPLPVVMLAHAVLVLLTTAFRGRAPCGPSTAFRAAAAAVLVVWFAYYANRPHPWNLSSYYLPYGVLLVDLVRYVQLRVRRRTLEPGWAAAVAVLLLVILPNLTFTAAKGFRQVRSAVGPALRGEVSANARLLSGVYLAEPAASELAARSGFITARADPIYLSTDSYLVPKLAGRFPPLPVVDFCWESTTKRDYERVLAAIVASPAAEVYLDAPGTTTYAASYCAAFYDRVREDIARHFERAGASAGWEVWTRR